MNVRQAIVTKYFGPTNVRGSRIKATAYAKSKTIPYDHALNIEDNHMVAAETLATELKWDGKWHQGGHPGGNGYVFVWDDAGVSVAFKVAKERP